MRTNAWLNQRRATTAKKKNKLLLIILAILLPPLAVYLAKGKIAKDFWINVLLCILFWLPGIIHALYIVL